MLLKVKYSTKKIPKRFLFVAVPPTYDIPGLDFIFNRESSIHLRHMPMPKFCAKKASQKVGPCSLHCALSFNKSTPGIKLGLKNITV